MGAQRGGTVTIDAATPAHSGSKSVHVHADDNDYDTLFVLHDARSSRRRTAASSCAPTCASAGAMARGHNTFIIADPFATQGTGNNVRIGERTRC